MGYWKSKTYLDRKTGYLKYRDSGKAVHRDIAYKYIYLQNRDKFPLPFTEYVVHHKDGNKTNNHSSNLRLMSRGRHHIKHGYVAKGVAQILLDKIKEKI